MRNFKAISALFICSGLLLTACEPSDKSVTDSKTRSKIQARNEQKKKAGNGSKGGAKKFRVGSFGVASVLMEKQVEAIELLQLALDNDKALKTQYKVTDEQSEKFENGEVRSMRLTANAEPLNYAIADRGNFAMKITKQWIVKMTLDQEGFKSATIETEKKAFTNLDKESAAGSKKTFLNMNEDSIKIVAQRSEQDSNLINVNVVSKGQLNGRINGDSIEVDNFTIRLDFKLTGSTLATSEVFIKKTAGVFTKEEKGWSTQIEGEAQVLKTEGLCNELSGQAVIFFDKKAIVFDKDQVYLNGNKKMKSAVATCGKRPAVDISRLLM